MSPNNDAIWDEVRERLKSDSRFDWAKRETKGLADGICPQCGCRDLYISLEKPYRISCRRENKCSYSVTTKELYPEIFNTYSNRYNPTKSNPNATADAYMEHDRHFDLSLVRTWYDQGEVFKRPTVRFILENGVEWHRFIDKADADKHGKNRIFKNDKKEGYSGKGWAPPPMEFNTGDTVFITEGIFKAIALFCIGKKAITGLSANNLPIEIIKAHTGKRIKWIVALDNDKAGLNHSPTYMERIRSLGEETYCIFPPAGYDWDDLFRLGRLTERMIQDSAWLGRFKLSESEDEKGFLLWLKTGRMQYVFPNRNALYKYKIEIKDNEGYKIHDVDFFDEDIHKMIKSFAKQGNIQRISNCRPEFLYFERDKITNDLYYFFKVFFMRGGSPETFAVPGDLLDSKGSFSKALLKETTGGTFDGSDLDMKIVRDEWLNRKDPHIITSVPFCGYDKESRVYIFPRYAYSGGTRYELNENDYFEIGTTRIKCGYRTSDYAPPDRAFSPFWFRDFRLAFGNNGMTLLAWWLGTLFAEQIRQKTKDWPFLEYTGDQGAGKSTQIEFCWRLLGRDGYEGFDPSAGGTTKVGLARNFQQVANMPVVLIEGDRQQENAKRAGFDTEELKKVFNGRGIRTIGTKKRGAGTEEPPFRGAICISQNATVSGSEALLARIVHCHVTREGFSPLSREAADRLKAAPVEQLSPFVAAVLEKEEILLPIWEKMFQFLRDTWGVRLAHVQGRLIENHAKVAAWLYALQELLGRDQLTDAILTDAVDHIVARCELRQNQLRADHPMVEKFWQLYETYNIKIGEYGTPIELLNLSNKTKYIAINMLKCFELFAEKRQQGMDLIELQRLLPNGQKYKFIRQGKVKTGKNGTKVYHCWIFEKPKETNKNEFLDD